VAGAALGEADGTATAGADVEGAEDAVEDAEDDPQAAASMIRPTAPTAVKTLALDHVVTVTVVHAAQTRLLSGTGPTLGGQLETSVSGPMHLSVSGR
jgi:hypothetical protein